MVATKPWSIRIPAAIAAGKGKLNGGNWVSLQHKPMVEITSILTAGEVALAKALMITAPLDYDWEDECDADPRLRTLREFTEKIEMPHD